MERQNPPNFDPEKVLQIVGPEYFNIVLRALASPEEPRLTDSSIEDLIACLDLDVRTHFDSVIGAVQELGIRGDGSITQHLVLKLGHPSYRVRQEAFMAICMIEYTNQSRELVQKILDGTKVDKMAPLVSMVAVAVLEKIGLRDANQLVDLKSVKSLLGVDFVPTSLADDTNQVDAENHGPFIASDGLSIFQDHLKLRMAHLESKKADALKADLKIALAALEAYEQGTNVKNELAKGLAYPSIEVRKETLLAIARMGYSAAVPDILSLIKTEVDPDLIAFACAVLETFGEKVSLEGIHKKARSMVEGRLVMARHDLAHNSYPELTEGNPMIH